MFAQTLDPNVAFLLLGTCLLLMVMVTILVLLSRSLSRLRRGAERFAEGDLSQRLEIQSPLQIAAVAESLNRMASQLEERLNTVVQQRNELDAVLGSLAEGVLAVDRDERLLNLNPMGARLLGTDPVRALGRSLQEVVRNAALQQFVSDSLASDRPLNAEVVLAAPAAGDAPADGSAGASAHQQQARQRYLQVQGTALRDGDGRRIGALIVLHDVTRVHHLEKIRRDFVANVSHEIKTPVTAIKAAIETVLDHDAGPMEQVQPFLHIVERQADRLEAIIEDLLSLARIEQDGEQPHIDRQESSIPKLLQSVVETCHAKAQARGAAVIVECDPDLTASINSALVEQAAVNLLDNAIKYSPEHRTVRLSAAVKDGELVIAVRDQGLGIAAEHLPRLFERFYRTDRARSRALGGTGLGLAIVKHIAQAHGGRVSVESTPGNGSTFRIHLPV